MLLRCYSDRVAERLSEDVSLVSSDLSGRPSGHVEQTSLSGIPSPSSSGRFYSARLIGNQTRRDFGELCLRDSFAPPADFQDLVWTQHLHFTMKQYAKGFAWAWLALSVVAPVRSGPVLMNEIMYHP